MSGHGQFQGATVFKALVQRRLEVHPDGVRVVLLGLCLVAAHHLKRIKTGKQPSRQDRVRRVWWLRAGRCVSPYEPGRQRASSGCFRLRSSSWWPGSGRTLCSSAAASEPEPEQSGTMNKLIDCFHHFNPELKGARSVLIFTILTR